MAKKTQQQLFEELLARYESEIAKAFQEAVEELRGAVNLARVIEALQRNDVQAALDALNLEQAAYDRFLDTIRNAYVDGGRGAVETIGRVRAPDGSVAVIRFDGRNRQAEAWLRNHSSTLVTRIVDDQRSAVRAALVRSLERGQNPKTAALDIVGRINPATKAREGGILGLTTQQEGFVANARDELASGDPALLRAYLQRQLRDRRFDRSVTKAIREETPLPAETVAKAVTSYRNRLLDLRGRTIGLTESLAALNAAKHEAYRQAVENGQVAEADVRKVWDSVGDSRVRHSHAVMDGKTAGLNEPFRSPTGALLMYPGGTTLGAPASETVGCRCQSIYRIDFLANLR